LETRNKEIYKHSALAHMRTTKKNHPSKSFNRLRIIASETRSIRAISRLLFPTFFSPSHAL